MIARAGSAGDRLRAVPDSGVAFLDEVPPRREDPQGIADMCATEDGEDTGVVAPATVIVRAWRDAAGRLHGVVERVATGEKARFDGADAMAALVREMVARPSRGDMSRG
jgi:hypothetical protein